MRASSQGCGDVGAALEGRWFFARRITGQPEGRVRGTAVLARQGDTDFLYTEAGRLVTATGTFEVRRSFLYRDTADGLRIDFADGPNSGTRFVTLRFTLDGAGAWGARALHPCGADRYDVGYRLALPGAWTTEIDVAGPKKRYRAVTHYRPIGAASRLSKPLALA